MPRSSPLPSPPLLSVPASRQRNALWVRILYRGREDGWVLTSNKRGPCLSASGGDADAIARDFQAQEALLAGAASTPDHGAPEDERPLTGVKSSRSDGPGDRPLDVGGKGSWVPPSEFPPGQLETQPSGGDGNTERGGGGQVDKIEYMTAQG